MFYNLIFEKINMNYFDVISKIDIAIEQTEQLIKKKKAEDDSNESSFLERVRLIEALADQKYALETIKSEFSFSIGQMNKIEDEIGFEEIDRMLFSLHLLKKDDFKKNETHYPKYAYVALDLNETLLKKNKAMIDDGIDQINSVEKLVSEAAQIYETYSALDIYEKIEEQNCLNSYRKTHRSNDEPGGGTNGTPGGDER